MGFIMTTLYLQHFLSNSMKYLIVCFSLLIAIAAKAQNHLIAEYLYEHESTGFEGIYTLRYSNGISHYEHHHTFKEVVRDDITFFHHHNFYDWYYDQSSKQIVEYATLEDGYKLKAKWSADFQWQLVGEEKTINGYKVQKAVGLSHDTAGRGDYDFGDVIAWFTMEIPISSGPERYYGLPGLIIKIEFSKRSMTCELKTISFDNQESITVPDDNKVINVSKEQIIRDGIIDKKWLKKEKKKLDSGEY